MKKLNPNEFQLKYIVIPIEAIAEPKLPWSAKALFGLIELLDNPKRGCWAKNDFFADVLGSTSQTITNHISLLKKLRFITVEDELSKNRIIRINPTYKKLYMLPIRNFIGSYINKDDSYNLDNSLSKDIDNSLSKDIDKPKGDSSESQLIKNNPLLDYWNGLPNIQKHISPKTKTYQRSCNLLRQLRQGIFTKRNHINPDFLKRNKIPAKLLNKKWSNTDLKIIMDRLSKLHTGGYWPEDKSSLSKSLEGLLYNPRTNTSMFLMVAANEPKPLRKRQRTTDPNPGLTEEFSSLLNGNIDNPHKLYNGIQSIIDFHSRIRLEDDRVDYHFDYPYKLCRAYAKWLEDQGWIDEVTVGHISTKTKTWRMFIKETENNLNIKLS